MNPLALLMGGYCTAFLIENRLLVYLSCAQVRQLTRRFPVRKILDERLYVNFFVDEVSEHLRIPSNRHNEHYRILP